MPEKSTTYLINRSHLRSHLLEVCAAKRAHTFTRVGANVYHEADQVLKQWALRKINQQPSKGQTIL